MYIVPCSYDSLFAWYANFNLSSSTGSPEPAADTRSPYATYGYAQVLVVVHNRFVDQYLTLVHILVLKQCALELQELKSIQLCRREEEKQQVSDTIVHYITTGHSSTTN